MSLLSESVLQHRDFRLYQLVRLCSVLAVQIEAVAIGWQLYDITGQPVALGLVGLAQFLPFVTFALPAGHAADRHERRGLLMFAQSGMTLCAFALLGLTVTGTIHDNFLWVYVVLAVFGTMRAFNAPASTAFIPNLVPRAQLPQAVAFSSTTWQVATIVGPSLGGVLYGAWGPTAAYATSASLGTCALLGLAFIRTRSRGGGTEAMTLHSLLTGFRFIRSQRVLFGTITLDLAAVLLGGAVALLPVYAKDILNTGAWGLGLLRSAPAVGAATTALWLAWHPPRRRVGPQMLMGVSIYGVDTLIFGVSTWLPLSLAALVLLGAADVVSVVIPRTLELTLTPDDMRGRVGATNMIAVGASNELGDARAGLSAWLFGTVPAVLIGGVGSILVVSLWSRIFPELRQVENMEGEAIGPSSPPADDKGK